MRHTVFLEGEVIRGSTVPQEIWLEEKQVYVPTLMVVEPFLWVPTTVTPIVQGNMVAEPIVDAPVTMAAMLIVGSPMAEIDEEEPDFKNLLPIMRKGNNSLLYRMCHIMDLLKDLRELEGQLSLVTMRFMLAKKFKWRVIPPHLKKPREVPIHPNGLSLRKMKWVLWGSVWFRFLSRFATRRLKSKPNRKLRCSDS
jgi:hypothetical protein